MTQARSVARVLVVALLLAALTSGAWAQNAMSAFRIDEQVAHFNMHTGSFWVPDRVNVSVDYNYTGGQGTPVFAGVEVWSGGSRDARFGHVPFRIDAAGRGRSTHRISVVPDRMPLITQAVGVDRLVFTMYRGGQAPFFTHAVDVRLVFTMPFDQVTREHLVALEPPPSGTGSAPQTGEPEIRLAQAPSVLRTPQRQTPQLQTPPVLQGPALQLPATLLTLPRYLSPNRVRVGLDTQHMMIAGKTNQGRYYVAMAEQMPNSDLYLRKWKVLAPNGSVHRSGTDTRIQRTYTLDLDSGAAGANTKDLWWEFQTETERYLSPRNGARLVVVHFSRANFPLNALPTKRIYLELDKIQGADWTPYVVERGGGRHSTQSIYAAAGIELRLLSDQGNIVDLKDGEAYSRAELDAFFDANYGAPAPAGYWHMHGAMMTRYTRSGTLGVMFRTGDRRGFAVFTNAFGFAGAERDAFVLRTTAHELGHALNLFHNDADAHDEETGTPIEGQGRTIMNQTWTRAPDWGYGWNDRALDHLNNHPLNRIQPNTGHGWSQCIESHPMLY